MKAVKGKWSGRSLIFILILSLVFSVSNIYTQENEPAFKAGEEKVEERDPDQPVQPIVQPPIQPIVEQPVDQNKAPVQKEKEVKKNLKKKTFKLNFKEVEMTEFLNMMSELIGKNIIVDEKVRGKITITSVKEIPVANAYEVMKSILELKGFAVVETPSLLKIVPVQDAVKKNVEIIIDGKRKEVYTGEEQTITYLLNIEFADANEIANTLRSLKSAKTDVVVYATLNILIFSGTSSEIDGLIKIAKALDVKPEEAPEEQKAKGNIHVVHLENADAEQLAGVLARIPFSENAKIMQPGTAEQPTVKKSAKTARTTQTQAVTQKQDTTKLSIIANKETNSLIITAMPDEFKEIIRLIKELDIVREQVLIEALIVEVSADSGWNLGVDWMLGNENNKGSVPGMYGGSSIMGAPPTFSDQLVAGKKVALPIKTGFQIGYLSSKEMLGFALLSLSKSDNDFNILSTPQILTIDNHEAELNIGEEIPVASNNRISDAGTQFYTYEYKSVGIKLKITPHITNKDRITLDLYQEANDVIGTSEGSLTPPRLSKRDISTKVTIQDGRTIVVGGLIKNSKVTQESKIPVLGDIPVLGWLFKHMSTTTRKTNLLVFLTPYVVTKPEKADAVTQQRKEEQRRLQIR